MGTGLRKGSTEPTGDEQWTELIGQAVVVVVAVNNHPSTSTFN